MGLITVLQEAIARGEHPRKSEAISRLRSFIAGNDVIIGAETVNLRRNVDELELNRLFFREFGRDGKLFVNIAGTRDRPQFFVADVGHSFVDSTGVPVIFTINTVISSGNKSVGFCFCVLPDKNIIAVMVDVKTIYEEFCFIQQAYTQRGVTFPNEALLLMFHDEVINQLVVSELLRRGISPLEQQPLVKCLLSPQPTYSMLFAIIGMEKRDAMDLKESLGLRNIFDLLIVPETIRGERALAKHILDLRKRVLKVAEERVSLFLAQHGIGSLDEIMPRARVESVRSEILMNEIKN